ncbi:MAG TPA: hypothetical protein VKM55_11180 [Candidatus Lokiarchaeia archaeon]|nr:hypothetical protein [Candidatus Lokiarchaeia archaeon]
MKNQEKHAIYTVVAVAIFVLAAWGKTLPINGANKALSSNVASVRPSTTWKGTLDYHNAENMSFAMVTGNVLNWSFSTSPTLDITVLVMDAEEFASWSAVSGGTYYLMLSAGYLTSDSGVFHPSYNGTFYIVFWNDYFVDPPTNITATATLGAITITNPTGSSSWASGSIHDITWLSAGTTGHVNINYDISGMVHVLAQNVVDNGSYPWSIPSNVSGTCKMYIYDPADSYLGTSSPSFSITSPSITPGFEAAFTVIGFLVGVVGIIAINLKKYHARA